MELMQGIAQIAQMIGVPCVCLGAVMWYVNQLDLRQRAERKTWYENHESEAEKWTEAINNNTKVISELVSFLKKGEGNEI